MPSIIKRISRTILASLLIFGFSSLLNTNIYPLSEGRTRVMSFNLRFKFDEIRMTKACKLIAQYYPDSIGLQECTYLWMTNIRLLLPEYGYIGTGRDNGTRNFSSGEQNSILYRKDKYYAIESGSFWLSDTPNEPSIYDDAQCNRICTWAVLQNKKTGQRYAHVNTHLDNAGPAARKKGLQMVIEKALSFNIPTVLTGDFNFDENDKLFKSLEESGLIYTKTAAADTMTSFTYHDFSPETTDADSILDYIYVNSSVKSVEKYKVINETIDGRLVSDHYPVMAELIL